MPAPPANSDRGDGRIILPVRPSFHALRQQTRPLVRAGWVERVDLPDLGLTALSAKLDTGARTSALHVEAAELAPRETDLLDVVLSPGAPPLRVRRIGWADVVTSSGHRERRPVIETRLRLGPFDRVIRLTLADRRGLSLPMLLGRSALLGLLIDPTRRHLLASPQAVSALPVRLVR